MPSKREAVLQAAFAGFEGIDGPKVLRNAVLPERIPAEGILIFRDGDPGEPETLLSPLEYVYRHRAEIEVVVEAGTPAERDAIYDGLLVSIGGVVDADRTLGGLCDYAEAEAPEPVDLDVDGAPGLKAAVVPIILHYGSADPLA